ncbi:Fe-S cluster assembly protein SufD [Thioclava sp. SK-1]|uniref:SufB/SufD family protein n=1 Tax=Thioclava sp. SK-1 TaxID=1889770 RepID=UPI0008259A98|nr:SufD family Fe-S cluster assembly protein [Thioclava sp. SK-1]OCX67017.1 Fe-S cluster assembly protein SufD [Thioclava sp. SK-1]
MAVLQQKRDAAAARLDALTVATGDFTAAARSDALARVQAQGLPARRDEYWRWTNPAALNAVAPSPAAGSDAGDEFAAFDRIKLVFVDGVFDAAASDDLSQAGIELLSAAGNADIHWAGAIYGTLEKAGQTPVDRPFAALNTATATEGVLIRVTGKAPKPVHLQYIHSSDHSDPILHHIVKLEEGAELTLLESGTPGARFNVVTEVCLSKDAKFNHIRVQGAEQDRQALTHIFTRVAEGAAFKSFTMTMNGVLTRNECVIDIIGDDAVAHVAGAALGDGKTEPFHHDDTVFITHGALRGESRQVFKKVLKNGANGIFQGKILVKEGAQKTDGYQISQSLLLDDDSQFLAKPELEIYADDVVCSHGSTTGSIDQTAMFYLRSRGVPVEDATAMLVLSFMADAVDEIEDEALRDDILSRLEAWLSRHRS